MKTITPDEELKKAISLLLNSNNVASLARLLVRNESLLRQHTDLKDFTAENLQTLVNLENNPIPATSAREFSIARDFFRLMLCFPWISAANLACI